MYTSCIHAAGFSSRWVSDFRPHDLRHSYATDLKLLGVSTREIQAALGHATESVTERYLSDLDGFNLKSVYFSGGGVGHAFDPSTQEAEAGGLP